MQSIKVISKRLCRAICASISLSTFLFLPALAQDCPIAGVSQNCCSLAEPLDSRSVADGGYGWHPAPGGVPGLCQGLASRNTSGGRISLIDLREKPAFGDLPEVVTVAHRTLPVSPSARVVFNGSPLRPGAAFFLAGSFEADNKLIWITEPFSRRAQKFEAFGFEAVFRHAGRVVHTPLLFADKGGVVGARSEVRAIIRSTLPIGAAMVTMQPVSLDDLTPSDDAPRALDLSRSSAEQIEVTLPIDLPEAFQLAVIACNAGDRDCRATEDSAPLQVFRIIWPDP